MTPVVIDASALAAIIFGEPDGAAMAGKLDGATLYAPTLLQFELANTAWKKMVRHPARAAAIVQALDAALSEECGINWREVSAADVALVAHAVGCTAYDASYIWLAGMLEAELVTLDGSLVKLSAPVTT